MERLKRGRPEVGVVRDRVLQDLRGPQGQLGLICPQCGSLKRVPSPYNQRSLNSAGARLEQLADPFKAVPVQKRAGDRQAAPRTARELDEAIPGMVQPCPRKSRAWVNIP